VRTAACEDATSERRAREAPASRVPHYHPSIKRLILRVGRENARWRYLRIRGELPKLGIDVSATTIATVFRLGGLGPAPRRIGPNWAQFLRLQAYGLRSLGTPGGGRSGGPGIGSAGAIGWDQHGPGDERGGPTGP
jgi:hypothetical protein